MKSASFGMLFLLLSLTAFAYEDIGSIYEVLSEIQATQNIVSINQLDCGKITAVQFEELGDALMEEMHPGKAHEVMDAMMGGEGSQTLEAVHVSMGKSYLRCNGGAGNLMMQNMMGYGIPQAMMGFSPPVFYYDYGISGAVLALLVFSLALNAYLLLKRKSGKK